MASADSLTVIFEIHRHFWFLIFLQPVPRVPTSTPQKPVSCAGNDNTMTPEDVLSLVLAIISGVCWTTVYITAIRIGFKEQTYAIPLIALSLNFAWEVIYGIGGIFTIGNLQSWINFTWAIADVIILYTYFRFGRSEFPPFLTRQFFIAGSILVFVAGFAVQAAFIAQFDDMAPIYAAFLQNTLMSGLFIGMFVSREGMRGQSLVIALCKWIGTLAPTINFGIVTFTPLVLIVGCVCCVLDLVYIGLIALAQGKGGNFVEPVEDLESSDL